MDLMERFLPPEEVNNGLKLLLPSHVDDSWRMSREYRVPGIDPGGTTGWALFVIDRRSLIEPDKKILDSVEFWSAGQWMGPEQRHARAAAVLVEQWEVDAIVIEDFVLRTMKGGRDLLAPVRVSSAIEQELWDPSGVRVPVIKQQPALAMTTITDARMREVGLWLPGMPHANDGTRHVLTWLRRKKALLEKQSRRR